MTNKSRSTAGVLRIAVKSNVSTKDGIPADLLSTAKSETAKRRVFDFANETGRKTKALTSVRVVGNQ